MDLLEAWASWESDAPPLVLDDDLRVLQRPRSRWALVNHSGWQDAVVQPDFCAPNDTRLHLGLLPQPFIGDVRNASVYVLLLNPGLAPSDYYGEYEVQEYRAALSANLKQRSSDGAIPFLFLDPRFAWHGGFTWWHGKLAKVIAQLSIAWDVSFAEARARLGSALASIELIPYHSAAFRDQGGWLKELHSVTLARAFVGDFVLPRVERGQAIVIVTRKVAVWDLPKHPGVVAYSPSQARAAHLTPESPGGTAILKHLTGLP